MEEKRQMRRERKKRQRQLLAMREKQLRHKITEQESQIHETERKSVTYRCMAKTYWERWRYELEEGKKHIAKEREFRFKVRHIIKVPGNSLSLPKLPHIDRSMLTNPSELGTAASDRDIFVGRGSFGIVKFQQYRGIHVAVKEFLPRTRVESVESEAHILLKLSHPYVPLLLGICTSSNPFIMVMQYHGIEGKCITLHKEMIVRNVIPSGSYQSWLILCSELVEAVRYLHDDAEIVHNDLKSDNVILSESFTQQAIHSLLDFQIVVVDFGKATEKANGHRYNLNLTEKEQYRVQFRHLAPEVIDGTMKQGVHSDIYALGKILSKISMDTTCFLGLCEDSLKQIQDVTRMCISLKPENRPNARKLCEVFEKVLMKVV